MARIVNKQMLRGLVILVLLLALLAAYLAYRPGLTGAFVFDDFANITNNSDIAIQDLHFDTLKRAALSGRSGPLGRPISMLSFAVNYYVAEFNSSYFKMTNLVIHLGAGLGIFVLSLRLLRIYRMRFEPDLSDWHIKSISLAITAAWLLHPFNLTSVLYVVQRMSSLCAFFMIWGLVLFMSGRTRLLENGKGAAKILVSLIIFMPLAALTKETGVLMPILMLIIELTLFNSQVGNPAAHRFLIRMYAITLGVLPACAALYFIISHPDWTPSTYLTWLPSSYLGRDFTLTQRLLTETRVIWFYLHQIVLPNTSEMGLFHDDIVNSQGILTPLSTLFSIIGLFAILVLSWFARKKAPLITFGILFFLAGHLLESTVFPLEITHEHRNYLPMFGILLPLFFYMLYPLKYQANLRLRQIVVLLLIALFAYDTHTRATAWSNPFDLAKSELEHHPLSARDNAEMGNNYANITTQDAGITESYYQQARDYYEQSAAVNPNYTNGLFALIELSSARGKAVDAGWIAELKHRLQFSPAEPDIGNKLIQLLTCQVTKQCKLDNDDLDQLFHAALQNPTVAGPRRAGVLSGLSIYLVDIAKDYPAALDVMHQTIDSAPHEFEYRFTLVKYLGALRRIDEAKVQLETIKSMDHMGAHSIQIAAEEGRLAVYEKEAATRH